MTSASLVFPHQLFLHHPALQAGRVVYLIEEALFFDQYAFHKKKLVFHRASMKYYESLLLQKGFQVIYVDAIAKANNTQTVVANLPAEISELHYADATDDWLHMRLQTAAAEKGIRLIRHRTPAFLNSVEETDAFFTEQQRYHQTDFYIHQRQTRRILLDEKERPLGDKWSFDSENRSPYPKGNRPPEINLPAGNEFVTEAIQYVEKAYASNYGNTLPPFGKRAGFFPVTHREADDWLTDFFQQRFSLFGKYEDAMVAGEGLLYHSLLSPLLNAGLLTPKEVLDRALDAAVEYNIPLASLEGFVRQLIGWREFIRLVYEREGVHQRNSNYFHFSRRLPPSFWQGTTGLEPLDAVIGKVLDNCYTHHIERLMVLGNIMLLCEFHPHEVYCWFMELFIDAYDWVMVPNTYGMTQAADGGLMMTKPYISGSNYLLKMGNFKKGEWQGVWDALFWRFMAVHRDFFSKNPRLGMLLSHWDKMGSAKQKELLMTAEMFLGGLDS